MYRAHDFCRQIRLRVCQQLDIKPTEKLPKDVSGMFMVDFQEKYYRVMVFSTKDAQKAHPNKTRPHRLYVDCPCGRLVEAGHYFQQHIPACSHEAAKLGD